MEFQWSWNLVSLKNRKVVLAYQEPRRVSQIDSFLVNVELILISNILKYMRDFNEQWYDYKEGR